ncbi:hypothetical protein ARSEF4850_003221 [Beauveria asiatica]
MASSRNYRFTFFQWLDALWNGDWGNAETFVADDVIVNGSSMAGHAYIQKLKDDNFETARLDLCMVNNERAELAAGFVFPRSPEPLDEDKEWTAQTFFSFANDDKISAVQALAGANKSAGRESNGPINQETALPNRLTSLDLRSFYADYIDSINTGTLRDGFEDFEEISGLRFTIERLIVNEETQQGAARLAFTSEPTKNFRGIVPTGNPVSFGERAFYQLEEGRIKQVWSLLDLAAYQASIPS